MGFKTKITIQCVYPTTYYNTITSTLIGFVSISKIGGYDEEEDEDPDSLPEHVVQTNHTTVHAHMGTRMHTYASAHRHAYI